jgi:hypothetical protein
VERARGARARTTHKLEPSTFGIDMPVFRQDYLPSKSWGEVTGVLVTYPRRSCLVAAHRTGSSS